MAIQWYNAQTGGAPIVSLASYGITFSSGALDVLNNPKYIELGFDEEHRSIVVKPCLEKTEKSIEFIEKKRNGYVRISNKDFIRFVESKMDDKFKVLQNASKYLAKWKKEDQLLYIYLDIPLNKDQDKNQNNDQDNDQK